MGNDIENGAYYAFIGGGTFNEVYGEWASVIGGNNNTADGAASFAAGAYATASNDDSFVWSDGSTTNTSDTSSNQFIARASGGFYFYSSSSSTGVELPAGSGSFSPMSDRNAKNHFAPVNPETVLASVAALPMTTWSYKTEPGVRHIGPMAQDFHAAFQVGEDDRHIPEVDDGGVALAAIQGLNEKLNEKDAEIQDLKQQNDSLAKELDQLAMAVKSLEEKNGGTK
jgi:hypothetical protein